MKKLVALFLVVAVSQSLFGQQMPLFSQYYWTDFMINPAFTGIKNTNRIQAGYRSQWTGFEGAPKTFHIGGHSSIKKYNLGLGGAVFADDRGGAIRQNGFQLNLAYNLKFNDFSGINFGVSALVNQYSYNGAEMVNIEPDAVLQTNVQQLVPDMNFGLVYHWKNKLFVGLSSNQLIQSKLNKFNVLNLAGETQLIRHYYLSGSYLAKLNDKWDAEPFVLTRTTFKGLPQFELGSKFTYIKLLTAGFSYRSNESVVLLAGINYKQFMLAYSYDVMVSKLRQYAGGSHELLLSYQFTSKEKQPKIKVEKVKDKDGDGIADQVDLCPEIKGVLSAKGCPDQDNDSIADAQDQCPTIAGLKEFNGCPDTDKDGIEDSKDECPNDKGLLALNGCPDSDGDGVADKDDNCPNVAGLSAYKGCPDTDGDGIIDSEDSCPTVKGILEMKGCPESDADLDGIVDKLDECPNEKGSVVLNGCPDADSDGIADKNDACPQVAGTIENKGCPFKKNRNIDDLMLKKLVCETGKNDITAASKLVLQEIAQVLKEEPTWTIEFAGHTDNVGDAAMNLQLSKKRAETVRNLLISYGIEASRIKANYFGETKPIANNNTPEGRTKNRRIDFKIVMD
jgi:type IX secretion system PorP/SprF family membrane protein